MAARPQTVYVLVDVRFFFDVEVALRDVGFWLVVVVVADEVFHGVVGEKFLELGVKLRGQRFVMGQHQRGTVDSLDHFGDGEGLARTGCTQQNLML